MPNTRIRLYLSMKIGGEVSSLPELKYKVDVERFVAENENFIVLGGGTNTIFKDENYALAVGLMRINGLDMSEDGEIAIGAGEDWDEIVEKTINAGFQGLEALSGIPGTVGGAPIQNIGAYGSELKDVLEYLEAYDAETRSWVKLSNAECEFKYRDSRFKKEKGRFIITKIVLKLKKSDAAPVPDYKGIRELFTSTPTTKDVREAILETRANKLPDPKIIPNSGSFFKNPFVSSGKAESLKTEFPNIVTFPADNDVKISAGWLIEQCGFKGKSFGHVSVYPNNALVLTSDGEASFEDLNNVISQIQTAVKDKFGISLEIEPEIV